MRKIVLLVFAVLSMCCQVAAQDRQVTGTVTDSEGQPLVGVTVLVKGSTRGASTDVAGRYAVSVPSGATLQFSHLGYDQVEVAVGNKSVVDVTMSENTTALDDVVVVAFGTQKREAFTGSAAVVKSGDLAKRQSSNVMNALVGNVAGLQMKGSSGQPGSDSGVTSIRGFGSINANTSPLIVLDGAPYPGNMSNINMADIESVTVLKDAASAALYGARGASGVILITTKRGSTRDAVVSFDMKLGVNERAMQTYKTIKDPGRYYETYYSQIYNYGYYQQGMNAADADAYANEQMMTDLRYNVFSLPQGQNLIVNGKLNPAATLGNTVSRNGQEYYIIPDDWDDAVFHTSLRQEYNASVTGGNERSSFFMSAGYLNDEGIILKSGLERVTARLKADYQAKKWLKVGASGAYVHRKYNENMGQASGSNTGNVFAYATQMGPIYPIYLRDGNGNIMTDENGFTRYDYGMGANGGLLRPVLQNGNPVGENELNNSSSNGNMFTGNAFAEFTFLKDFKFYISMNTSVTESRASSYQNPYYGGSATRGGDVAKSHSRRQTLNALQSLTYHKEFNGHNLDVMLGHEYDNNKYYYLSGAKHTIFSPTNTELNGAGNLDNTTSYTTRYNTEGYLARVLYDYQSKYYLSGSYRRDASSRFHPDHRWGNFWSVGASWILSKENFMKQAEWVDMLKLKVSYGQQGNDGIDDFYYVDMYSLVPADNLVSTSFSRKGNPDITWETTGNFNTGVEFSLFGHRLNGSVEYYRKKTTDLLFWVSIPESSGSRGIYDNIGDLRNSGFEVDLNATVVNSRRVNWTLYANIAHNKNKILSLPESKIGDAGGYQDQGYWYGVGKSMYNMYIATYAGPNEYGQATYYKDVVENGEVVGRTTTTQFNEATLYEQGCILPKYYGGFGTSVNFYGFDFSVTFDYQLGGRIYDSAYASLMANSTGSGGRAIHRDVWKSWTPQNTSSNIPRYQYMDDYTTAQSSRFLVSSNYLNLQSINFGYTIPEKLLKRAGVSNLRVYLAVENVAFWSKRKGLDPRNAYGSYGNTNYYSPIRTISGGVQLAF